MSKQKIIADKQALIKQTREEIDILMFKQQRLLYKYTAIPRKYTETSAAFEYYGYIETFNKDSVRFNVVASTYSRIVGQGGRGRRNLLMITYDCLPSLTPVKKEDLPLLLGSPYRTEECTKILSGESKIKVG